MHVDLLLGFPSSETFRDNWQEVYSADPDAEFFLSWTWMSGWSKDLKHCVVLAAKAHRDADRYVAFFPLRFRARKMRDGTTVQELAMGGNRAADYTGFLAEPDYAEASADIFARVIKRKLNWQSFHLENICSWDSKIPILLANFPEPEYSIKHIEQVNTVDLVDLHKCPVVKLPTDWPTFLKTKLGKNTRRNVNRYYDDLMTCNDYKITDTSAANINEELNILFRFWQEKWAGRKHGKAGMFFRVQAKGYRHCFNDGSFFLKVLWHRDRPIGCVAGFYDRKQKSVLASVQSRDPTWTNPPVNFILHLHLIESAIEAGWRSYDFMRGNEAYKYRLGAEDRLIDYVRIERRPAA